MGRPNKSLVIRKALEEGTIAYFKRILSDDMEQMLWAAFMTGKIPQVDGVGNPIKNAEGKPFMVDFEPNPTCWQAFQRAVAYKRGTPTVTQEGAAGREPIELTFNILGSPTLKSFASEEEKQKISLAMMGNHNRWGKKEEDKDTITVEATESDAS